MDLIVTPAVLIPRPETEHLIETVLDLSHEVRAGGQECPPHASLLRFLDVGTGSGCIALALAKEFPDAEIHATDISAAALEVARANAARLQLEKRIQFRQGDLLEGLDLTGLDFVVSNPPYVGESEKDQVQLEVRKFEPRNAVFAGPVGVEVIERLLPQAHAALRPGGWLVLEVSGTIAGEVEQLLEKLGRSRDHPRSAIDSAGASAKALGPRTPSSGGRVLTLNPGRSLRFIPSEATNASAPTRAN